MEHSVKMRNTFALRTMQFIDEGYSEIDNESTMSLDLINEDCQFQEGPIYDGDGGCNFSDEECNDSSVEVDSVPPPFDREEVEQLELMHLIFTMTANGNLHLAPINWHPQRVLDIGCGTGTWCIEMADAYPSAEVVGVELSPSQPMLVPPNLIFQIDDFEDEWNYNCSFDYIHARLLAGRIRDWARLVRQCFESCNSGGWVEFQDIEPLFTSQFELSSHPVTSKEEIIYPGPFLTQWMYEAGFINIHVVKTHQPTALLQQRTKLQQMEHCSEDRNDEPLSTFLESCANQIRRTRDRRDCSSNEIGEGAHTSSVSINLYTVYGQKP